MTFESQCGNLKKKHFDDVVGTVVSIVYLPQPVDSYRELTWNSQTGKQPYVRIHEASL